jgi:hypothetical protein
MYEIQNKYIMHYDVFEPVTIQIQNTKATPRHTPA